MAEEAKGHVVYFDEFIDAAGSLELIAEMMNRVQENELLWKWIVIGLQNAMQAAMVLALAGSDGCGALSEGSQKKNRAWLQNMTPERPRQQMATFGVLLGRVQCAALLDGPVLAISFQEYRNLVRLNELRRQFAHYNPTAWGIELDYLLNVVPVALNAIEHLLTKQARPRLNMAPYRGRIENSLASARYALANFKQPAGSRPRLEARERQPARPR